MKLTSHTRRKVKENVISYLFLTPFLLVFGIFLGYPIFYSLFLSFHKTSIYSDWYNVFGDMQFCGLANYAALLSTDAEFWWSLVVTFIYAAMTIPAGIALSLLLAVLINNKLPGRSFFRSAYFLPNVLDLLVVGIIWVLIYSPRYGLLDVLLNKIGITYFSATGFLGNPLTALPAIALAMVLKGAGFGMILFLTAIQNISESVYEAADVDGASWWDKLRHITIPLVKPIILFMIITGVLASLNAFTEIYAMTNASGGPITTMWGRTVGATKLSGFYLFKTFERGQYGYAAAISYMLLLIALAISFVNIKLFKEE